MSDCPYDFRCQMSYEAAIRELRQQNQQLQAENKKLKKAVRDLRPTTLIACPKCELHGVEPKYADEGCVWCQLAEANEKIKDYEQSFKD